jgi:glutamate transport system permease protein
VDNFLTLFQTYNVPAAFWVNIQLTFWAASGRWCSAPFSRSCGSRRSQPPVARCCVRQHLPQHPLTIIIAFGVLGLFGQLQVSLTDDFRPNFFRLAILGLTLYHAAFVCEAIRSGVNTVPLGQAEAARAIGLSFLPAAAADHPPAGLPRRYRTAGNVLIALIKNSTVARPGSVAAEASSLMKTMIEFRGDLVIPIFLTFAIGFVILVIPVGLLHTWASRRLAVAR